jgi:hypothetical protein
MIHRSPVGRTGVRLLLFALCAAMVLGCGKGKKEAGGDGGSGGNGGAGGQAAEPKSEAKLTADALYKDIDKYQGKWVTVIARVPKVITGEYPDKHVELSIHLKGEDGNSNCFAEMEFKDASQAPKFEDDVRYEFLGQVSGSKNTGAKLNKCKLLGVSKGEGPAPEATVTAEELTKDAAKYKDKLMQVRGVVRTGTPTPAGAAITLSGEGKKFVTCVLAAGQFEKVLAAGRGSTVELKGVVTDVEPFVTMNDCTLVKYPRPALPIRAANFAREFTQKKDISEKYSEKIITLTGKVESAGDGKLVITGFSDSKGKKPMPQKIVAHFSPDWKDALAKVKPGEDVIVSGEFSTYSSGEINLSGCWLLPPR